MITDVDNIQNSKLKTQSSKLKTQSSKLKAQNSKLKAQNSKFKVQCSKFNVQSLQLFRQYEPSFVFLIEFMLKVGVFRHEFHI